MIDALSDGAASYLTVVMAAGVTSMTGRPRPRPIEMDAVDDSDDADDGRMEERAGKRERRRRTSEVR